MRSWGSDHRQLPLPTTPFIVAELSKNWIDDRGVIDTPILAAQFEYVININDKRGYRLHSFQIHRHSPAPDQLNETLIAVFERKRGAAVT
jgi:hypothetical protein